MLAHRDMTGTWTVPLPVLRIIETGHGTGVTGTTGTRPGHCPDGMSRREHQENPGKKGVSGQHRDMSRTHVPVFGVDAR